MKFEHKGKWIKQITESIQKNETMPPMSQRKRIEFEDDIVRVYDGNKEIYAGAEDYEPMQDENWKWDNANKYYKFGKYIKVCCESSQKNEGGLKYFTYTQDKLKTKADCDKALEDMKNALAEEPNMNAKLIIQKDMETVKSWKNQMNEGPNEFDKNKYKEDFFEYKNGGHGDFMEYLAKACMQADKNNLAKLEKAFPELLKVFCLWKSSGRTDKVNKL